MADDQADRSLTRSIKFRQWFRGQRSRAKRLTTSADGNRVEESPLPSYVNLLHKPQDPVTSQASNPDADTGTKASIFFQKLPPEIRRQILIAAFGNRTMHMEIRLPFPDGEPVSGGGRKDRFRRRRWLPPSEEANGNSKKGKKSKHNTSEQRPWVWWGCVCCRFTPGMQHFVPLHYDLCFSGSDNSFDPYIGRAPREYRIGVKGWLYACRQSYVEGMHVLYSTNTMLWEEGPLFDALFYQQENPERCLLPPANLELITSLEVLWKFELFSRDPEIETKERVSMKKHLQLLPRVLPGLRKLYISFKNDMYTRIYAPTIVAGEIKDVLINPLDGVLEQNPHLSEYRIGMPAVLIYSGPSELWGERYPHMKYWRPVEASNCPGSNCKGYWIELGEEGALRFDYLGKPYTSSSMGLLEAIDFLVSVK